MQIDRLPLTAALPVSLEAVKAYARILQDDDDATLEMLIRSGADLIEHRSSQAILAQTITITTTAAPVIALPIGPATADVPTVEQVNEDGTTEAITEGWTFTAGTRPTLAYRGSFIGQLRITYTAGHATADDVPHDLQQAICEHVLWSFDGKGVKTDERAISPALVRVIARRGRLTI